MATNNAYQMVTDRIIDMMNKGIIPWHRPWHFNGIEDGTAQAISYTSRRAYSLLNQWLLGEPGEYLTFNQIKERKGSIRKGEKARMVVFFKQQQDLRVPVIPAVVFAILTCQAGTDHDFHYSNLSPFDKLPQRSFSPRKQRQTTPEVVYFLFPL